MISFDDWYTDLISNYVWFQPASLHHKPETFKAVANKVYMQYVASENFPPIQEARKHVYNKLCLVPGDKPKVDWVKKAQKEMEKKPDWQPVSWEKRAEYLDKLQEIIKGSTMANGVPRPSYKEQAEEGLDRPKKMPPYPITSKEEYYTRQRHIEYIKQNYEPRTGLKKPGWVEEDLFNVLYDEKNFEAYWKQFEV